MKTLTHHEYVDMSSKMDVEGEDVDILFEMEDNEDEECEDEHMDESRLAPIPEEEDVDTSGDEMEGSYGD